MCVLFFEWFNISRYLRGGIGCARAGNELVLHRLGFHNFRFELGHRVVPKINSKYVAREPMHEKIG